MGYADAKKAGAVLGYGQFLTYVVNFLIVAFVLFMVIKAMNSMKKAEASCSCRSARTARFGSAPRRNPRSPEEEVSASFRLSLPKAPRPARTGGFA